MKITGKSNYVKIEYNGKTVKADGEMVVEGFVAYKNTMKSWEPPHETDPFTEDDKAELITAVDDYCKDKEFRVFFE